MGPRRKAVLLQGLLDLGSVVVRSGASLIQHRAEARERDAAIREVSVPDRFSLGQGEASEPCTPCEAERRRQSALQEAQQEAGR